MSDDLPDDVVAEMQAGPELAPQPYARCTEDGCGLEFVDREAMSAHLKETLQPTEKSQVFSTGLVARGHRAQVVNPTPEERQSSRVRAAIGSALDSLYEELDDDVRRGRFTEEEVASEMRWFDLGDGWDDYISEVER